MARTWYVYKFVSSFQLQVQDPFPEGHIAGYDLTPTWRTKTFLVREDGVVFEAIYDANKKVFSYVEAAYSVPGEM